MGAVECNVMQLLQESSALFRKGKVSECKLLLENLEVNLENEKFSVCQWIRENNSLVCSQQAVCACKTITEGDVNKFEELLDRVQGFPSRLMAVTLEVTVACNLLVIQLMSQDAKLKHEMAQLALGTIHHVLNRVSIARAGNGADDQEEPELEDTLSILRKVLPSVSQGELQCLVLLVCACAVHQVRRGRLQEARQLLQPLSAELETRQGKAKEEDTDTGAALMLWLSGTRLDTSASNLMGMDGKQSSADCAHVVRWLQILVHFKLQEYPMCLQIINSQPSSQPYHQQAKYLKGFILYKDGHYQDAIACLTDIGDAEIEEKHSKAMRLNLIGCCLGNQNLAHSAINRFREALETDFGYLMPLYNISLQYCKLGLLDAELETLNLLVTALESNKKRKGHGIQGVSTAGGWPSMALSLYCPQTGVKTEVTAIQASYALASRCFQLKRYDVAATKYLKLLAKLAKSDHTDGMVLAVKQPIAVPGVQQILHEAAFALLKSGRYLDAVVICDKAITKYSPVWAKKEDSQEQSVDINKGGNTTLKSKKHSDITQLDVKHICQETSSQKTIPGKRKRSASARADDAQPGSSGESLGMGVSKLDYDQDVMNRTSVDVQALLYKSQALNALERSTEALQCVDSVIASLESLAGPGPNTSGTTTTSQQPKTKRPRLHCGATNESGVPSEVTKVEELLAEAHKVRSLSLVAEDRLTEALYHSRISLQYTPDNWETVHNHSLVLLKLGRQREAINTWLHHRGIHPAMDSFQLHKLLTKKADLLHRLKEQENSNSETEGDLSSTQHQILNMDHTILKLLESSKDR